MGYTRAGNFASDANGRLTTQDGYLVEPTDYDPGGRHRRHGGGQRYRHRYRSRPDQPQTLGTIELAMFPNLAACRRSAATSWS